MGIGPRGTREDDVVAVIAGAETPFILRPVIGDEVATKLSEDFRLQSKSPVVTLRTLARPKRI